MKVGGRSWLVGFTGSCDLFGGAGRVWFEFCWDLVGYAKCTYIFEEGAGIFGGCRIVAILDEIYVRDSGLGDVTTV